MTLLGGVAVLTAIHQTRGKPQFLYVLLPLSVIEPLSLYLLHSSLGQIVVVLDVCMAAIVVGLASLYVLQERVGNPVKSSTNHDDHGTDSAPASESISVVTETLLGPYGTARRLRILILNYRCPRNPRAGGAERFTHEVACRLVARGHTVEWFSASFPNATKEETLNGIHLVRAGGQL